MYWTLLKRELTLQAAGFGEVLTVPAIYLLGVCFFVLGRPYGEPLGDATAAAALWLCALIALGLTQYRIWESDVRDGTLEQYALLPLALEGVVAVKLAVHWLCAGLPLVLLSPLMGALLDAPLPAFAPLFAGTAALTALGSVAGAVSLRFSSRQALTLLLVFPLSVPALILGAAASLPAAADGGFSLLAAYALALIPLCVAATAGLLRIELRSG